jgi:RNA polymerase sigma-70 factor (ECF subfamily)
MRIEPEPDSAQGDLIVRLKRGDCQAYRELLDEYGEQLYGTALRITISATDAEDAVQETLLSTFQHIGTFESRSSLRTWLTRVCINAALTRIRRNSRHKIQSLDDTSFDGSPESSRELPDHRENPEQALRGSELQGLLDRYLRALSPGLRQVFVLRDVEEMSGEETALLLGITVAAVKTRLARARQALRRNLGPHLTTIRSTMALQPAR